MPKKLYQSNPRSSKMTPNRRAQQRQSVADDSDGSMDMDQYADLRSSDSDEKLLRKVPGKKNAR